MELTPARRGRRAPPGAPGFLDEGRLLGLLRGPEPEAAAVRAVLDRSLAKEPLGPAETALLLRCRRPAAWAEIGAAARTLKEAVYGRRVVLFAPLYVGSLCANRCRYCAFRADNPGMVRTTLEGEELDRQVAALERAGHKRLILVFGEHPRYTPAFLADTVRRVYSVRAGRGEIRRVNLNAAPLAEEGFRTVKAAGIGTYQVFMETYHRATYRRWHPPGTAKGDFDWRLAAMDRALAAGCGDVGLGVLLGLYSWRFEVLGLVAHARHLQERFGVGPHTVSFPRLRPAQGVRLPRRHRVTDEELGRLIAVLRLALPYAGLILTAREPAPLRRALLALGVSQIDGGSRIELGGYTEGGGAQRPDREQFELGDLRSLDEVMGELLADGWLPSFCTACYRLGRTGEHFMEFAVPGFIKRFCTPNALATLAEYLEDYASEETRRAGERVLAAALAALPPEARPAAAERLERIRRGERDLYT